MGFEHRRQQLQQRREALCVRSAELRLVVAGQAAVLHAPLALADRVRAGLQWMRANPQWVIGALTLTLVLRPRRSLRWAGRIWWGYGLWRRAQGVMQQWAAPVR